MTTKKKKRSKSRNVLEELRGGPLSFGKMIESIRKADEVSQVELACRMNISRAHLCDIEKERRTVSPGRAALFAKKLGYSVGTFVAIALEDAVRNAGLKLKVHVEAA